MKAKKNQKPASAQSETRPKKKTKRSSFSRTVLYLLSILVVSAVLATTGILLSNDLFALAKPDRDITVTIPEDASIGEVSKLLDKSGVVNYGSFFRLFTGLVYKDIEFRPGMWTLNSDMDYRAIVNAIRLNSKSTVTVTIPEGYTIEDIIDTLVENGLSSEDELKKVLQNSTFTYDFLPEEIGNETNSLEGYLFPDTYEFYVSDSAETIIAKMLGNFENKINDTTNGKSLVKLCEENDMSISDMVIIASMVEKESVNADDMLMVSGVIANRLKHSSEYPYLNIDATIQYVVGHTTLTSEDMEYESPYNTYTSKGLPPGPICNPGYDALLAAVQPSVHDYYYYVANADRTAHIYAKTQEEQSANIAAVQKQRDASNEDDN